MAQRQQTQLVELLDSEKAFELMGEYEQDHNYAGLYGDNGGDPDGDLWLAEDADMPDELIAKLVAARVAERVAGWKVTPYTEPSNYSGYCGYTSNRVAYTLKEETAWTIQADEANIEDAQ
jgi:hypothetical protein